MTFFILRCAGTLPTTFRRRLPLTESGDGREMRNDDLRLHCCAAFFNREPGDWAFFFTGKKLCQISDEKLQAIGFAILCSESL
jgi:hypothetical protein